MNYLHKRLPTDRPLWALFCTIDDRLFLFGIIDNEIDAVREAEWHMERCGEDHRKYVHLQALPADAIAVYNDEVLPYCFPNKECIRDVYDPDKNLYRPKVDAQ